MICSASASLAAAILHLAFILLGPLSMFVDPIFILVMLTFDVLLGTIVAMVVAAPFVAIAALIGSRLRAESFYYYSGLGGACAGALGLFPVALHYHFRGTEQLTGTLFVIPALATCGFAWGAGWWWLYRRWKVAGS